MSRIFVGMNPAPLQNSASVASHSCTSVILFCFLLFPVSGLFSQDTTIQKQIVVDSITQTPASSPPVPPPTLSPEQIKKRTRIVIGANVVGYGATMIALYNAWYKDYPQSSFHTINDWHEWKQMDKVGHMYSAYIESRASMELWRWTGIDRKKRIWLGGMSGAFYQTVIEVLDGFSEQWGWSWYDFSANILGSGILVAQELAWDDQRIKLKFSYHKKNYSDPELQERTE